MKATHRSASNRDEQEGPDRWRVERSIRGCHNRRCTIDQTGLTGDSSDHDAQGQQGEGYEQLLAIDEIAGLQQYPHREHGSDEAIAAALLHDIGHYSGEFSEDALELGQNNYHEEAGSNLLQDIFPEEVVDPVKLHVTAKRYLCTINSNYLSCLSEASIHSLHLQGGPLKAEEVNAFEKNKHLDLCLKLRHWDDAAKIPGTRTPSFNHYLHVLKRLVQPA